MRRLTPALLIMVFILSVMGCRRSSPANKAGRDHAKLADLGRPWPVEVGRFSVPFSFLAHDPRGLVFLSGRPGKRYRLDYRLRRLLPSSATPVKTELYPAKVSERDDRRLLIMVRPDGTETVVTESLLSPTAWARTDGGRVLVFYENIPEGAQLVYAEPLSNLRLVWRRLAVSPGKVALLWSGKGNYLVEESDGTLTVFSRREGLPQWSGKGSAVSFSPDERFLLYREGEGLRLVDLNLGFSRPLPGPGGGRLVSSAWSSHGKVVFYLYEAMEGEKSARFLYLYPVETGAWQRHPVPADLDPLAMPAFLASLPEEAGWLLSLLPLINKETLCRWGEKLYLAGQDREVVLVDLAGQKPVIKPLHRFSARVAAISVAGQWLALTVEEKGKMILYVWHLPAPTDLTGLFPDRRDLSLGPLRLGMPDKEVRAILGPPFRIERRTDPLTEKPIRTYFYPGKAVDLVGGRVERIISTDPEIATPRGVKVHEDRQTVLARYGRPDYELRDYLAYYGTVDGIPLKVAFKFDSRGRVTALLLAREEQKK